ncbi:aminoacyl-histidine dipeptidase [Clostridium sp. WILCCON 0269]|uniref:Aminoacyl-histidine dipeptidase n=1 Tax=Candidatus Clostridium eludens TaxID=3381663 RepID=A0ABW8SGQ0_9CLOT
MIRVLQDIEPAEVFKYFEELSSIPRESGNEKEISDYLVSFAKRHNLEVIQDKALNVVIKKKGTKGYENSPGVILQGHMDMVCEKNVGVEHDFTKDLLKLRVVDDMIYAAGTTLGGDDGIAIAMGLAILASKDIPHPPVELLATTSEETGMNGAIALDPKNITGRILVNIDSEEEGVLLVGCAGGCSAKVNIPIKWDNINEDDKAFLIKITGLKGGHSGSEIHKERANANKLMGRLLKNLTTKIDFKIGSIGGGSKHNVIACESEAIILVNSKYNSTVKDIISNLENVLKDEFRASDPGLKIELKTVTELPQKVMSYNTTGNVINFIYLIPNGVQSMSMNIEGLVESSLNLGTVVIKEDSVEFISSIRSSVRSLRDNIFNIIATIGSFIEAKVEVESSYPEWKYKSYSKIREIMVEVYEKLFGEKPVISAIHAGLECGIFEEKFNGQLDMVSLGPDIFDIHSPNEHLSIPSTQRTWKYLLEILKNLR